MKRWFVAALLIGGLAGCTGGNQGSLGSLVEDLGSSQAVPAFAQLDQSQDPAVFTALLEGTRNPQPRVRAQCARLLGRKKDVTAIASLRPLLADTDRSTRVQAARAVVVLADPQQVLEWLQDPRTEPPAREALAMALVGEQVEEVLPLLRQWLADRREPLVMRLIACQGLQQAGPRAQASQQLLTEAREPGNDLQLRACALEAYGCAAGPPAVAELKGWLQRPPLKLQEAALKALGHTRSPQALPLLAAAAQDASLSTSARVAAVKGIGESKDSPEARSLVLAALKDPDMAVRKAAAGSLHCFAGQPGVKEALREARRQETQELVEIEMDCTLKVIDCPPCK